MRNTIQLSVGWGRFLFVKKKKANGSHMFTYNKSVRK